MLSTAHIVRSFVCAGLVLTLASPAWALFGDDQARQAVLELRQELDEQRRANTEAEAAMRRSILDISAQSEQWRQELSTLRGEYEQLQHTLYLLEERIKSFEPISIEQDGTTLLVSPPEKAAFDRSMALLLASDFKQAAASYIQLLNQFPTTAYTASVLYWLGNAQYASQDVRAAINTHKRLVVQFPKHSRVPEAILSLGNAHLELGDDQSARTEWSHLVANHPNSEAASTARERLTQLPVQ